MTTPDFSSHAARYAKHRPGYPPELFGYLASLVDRHETAWDCATGNGQAALGLSGHFERVIATDVSAEQIRHATQRENVDYRVARSEESGLAGASVDLITVAAAIHWFDLASYYSEVRRVLRPGGVIAAWTYHVGHVEAPLDKVFHRFYFELLRPYFSPLVRLVDERYETLGLPGEALEPQERFHVSAEWNLEQMRDFIMSWSGVQEFLRDHDRNPIDTIAAELETVWGQPSSIHRIRWPLYVRVARVG